VYCKRTFETVLAQVGSIVRLSNEYIATEGSDGFVCKRTSTHRQTEINGVCVCVCVLVLV
jgi:hypothetical protein